MHQSALCPWMGLPCRVPLTIHARPLKLHLMSGWEWESEWSLERVGNVDGEGWAYFTGVHACCAC